MDGLTEGDIGKHLKSRGYAVIEGPDTEEALRDMQRLRKNADKGLRKERKEGWETGPYGFRTTAGGEATEAAVLTCKEGGAGQKAIRGMEEAIRKALGEDGTIEQAWMVTCGDKHNRIDRSRMNDKLHSRRQGEAHAKHDESPIGAWMEIQDDQRQVQPVPTTVIAKSWGQMRMKIRGRGEGQTTEFQALKVAAGGKQILLIHGKAATYHEQRTHGPMNDTTRRAIFAIYARKKTDRGERRRTTTDSKNNPLYNAKVETKKDAVTKLHYKWQGEKRRRAILTEKGRTWKQIAKRIRENEGAVRGRLRISREDGTTPDENQTLGSTEDLPTKNKPAEVRRERNKEENLEPSGQEEEKPGEDEDQQEQEEQKEQNSDRQEKEHETPHRSGNETKDRAEERGGKGKSEGETQEETTGKTKRARRKERLKARPGWKSKRNRTKRLRNRLRKAEEHDKTEEQRRRER